jgi:hypothetical protein
MSANTPPDPYFNNIDFNPAFFVAPTDVSGSGISQSFADTHYLKSATGDNAVSDANTTKFNNPISIDGAINTNYTLTANGRSIMGPIASTASFQAAYKTNVGLAIIDNNNSPSLPQQLVINDAAYENALLTLGVNYASGIQYAAIQSRIGAALMGRIALNPAGGNVGVGTTDPKSTLDVNGNLLIRAFNTSGDNTRGIYFRDILIPDQQYNVSITTFLEPYGSAETNVLSINAYNGITFCTGSNTRNERMRITRDGNVGIGSTDPKTKLDVNGVIINTNTTLGLPGIGTTGSNGGYRLILWNGDAITYPFGLGIASQTLWGGVPLGCRFEWYVGSDRVLYLNNGLLQTSNQITINGKADVGRQMTITSTNTTDAVEICFLANGGGQLLIGQGRTAVGSVFTGKGYMISSGSLMFFTNNATITPTVEIAADDIAMRTSVTTYGNNYYTDGEYIPYQTRTNMSGTVLSGYFLYCGWFHNSLVNISVSHFSTSYTYWAGHIYCNNTPAPISLNSIVSSNMAFETFQQQGDQIWYIRMYPTVSYNTSTEMRVKFYG